MKMKFLFNVLLLLGIMIRLLGMVGAQAGQPVKPDSPNILPIIQNSYALLPGQGLVPGTKSYNSVAINPHDGWTYISYYNALTHKLGLASPSPTGGNCGTNNQWWCRDLTTSQADDMGKYSSIAFWGGPLSWRAGISFFDSTNSSLWFYEYSCPMMGACTTSINQIDQTNLWSKGTYSSLKYDSGGKPHIAYYTYGLLAPASSLMHAYKKGGGGNCGPSNTWKCELVDTEYSAYGRGLYPSLAIDSSGYPQISYYDQTNHTLEFASKLPPGDLGGCGQVGDWWNCATVEFDDKGGISTSLNLESSTDNAQIAYYSKPTGMLKFASYVYGAGVSNCGYPDEDDWRCQEIDSMGDFGSNPPAIASALVGGFFPVIVYEVSGELEPNYVKMAYPSVIPPGNCGGGSWFCKIWAAGGNSYTSEGGSISMAMRSSGLSVIVWDETDDYYATRALRVYQEIYGIFLPVIKNN